MSRKLETYDDFCFVNKGRNQKQDDVLSSLNGEIYARDTAERSSIKQKLAYGISEAAALLSISRSRLYICIKTGEIRTVKLGRRSLILASEIDLFLSKLKNETS